MKIVKKTKDPKPPKEVNLRKVFINALATNILKNTFWTKYEDDLFKEEEKIKINWEVVNQDFKEREKKAKVEEKPAEEAKKNTEETIVELKKVSQFEIILSKFTLSDQKTRESLVNFLLTYDQICQVMLLLPEDEVELS